MKKILFLIALIIVSVTTKAQTEELFKPYKQTSLRLPSIPLIVNDPYFSIWSPYDKLTDGATRHWTNDEKPLEGLLRVDGITYRFMGDGNSTVLESVIPMADETAWDAEYTMGKQDDGWQNPEYQPSGWKNGKSAFGSPRLSYIHTNWDKEHSDLYIRRTFSLTEKDLSNDLYLVYSHDDVFELFINGKKVVSTGETWKEGEKLHLDGELKALLKPGKNVISTHTHNTTGDAYTDFGIFKNTLQSNSSEKIAIQKTVSVMATSTYYTFACGPVELNLVFTAPMLIDNLDLLSTPINYISYQVRATDNKKHDVQFYIAASPLISANKGAQATVSSIISKNGMRYAKTGTLEQPILEKKGDGICIDWGHLYIPDVNGNVCLSDMKDAKASFASNGKPLSSNEKIISRKPSTSPVLTYTHDFGYVNKASSYMMIGYDEIYDIEYMYYRYKGYWARNGKTIFQAFDELKNNYTDIMNRCRELDKRIYDDGLMSGNIKYAEILSGSYRHVIAAHKLFMDKNGNLLFFSKENNSNGCVNTVDLTYPESPLFLLYNPELQKAMMTSIFDYSLSGRWIKPFAAHDLGTYPIANGQVYGGDMPLEESGNMIILTTMISKLEGNTKYADKYMGIMKEWVNYLAENGQDPSNQLCTDDFAGHWAHNCNLSIKAIMAIAGYAEMANINHDVETYNKYIGIAKEMAAKWEKDARENDHYKLAFDRANTWSLKYNMVWDKLWNTNIFPNNAIQREIKYYLGQQNIYGLPLDIRKTYTKSDWIMWTATMSKDKKTFLKFIEPIYKYINETTSRVPISDWHDTISGTMIGFKARSVIGGYWMKVLSDKLSTKK